MPIAPDFMKKPKSGTHSGHSVRCVVDPPKMLGVHGSQAVDQDLCCGDAICESVCPASIFEMIDTSGNLALEQQSDPVNEVDCIFCRASEVNCPAHPIKITEE